MNVRLFPFDTQNCTFQFGSWSYPDRDMKIYDKNGKGILTGTLKFGQILASVDSSNEIVKIYQKILNGG